MREIILVGTRQNKRVKSLIVNQIQFLPIQRDLSDITSLIFTSRYAILSLIDSAKVNLSLQDWYKLPSYVIGASSAKILKEHHANIAFIGSDAHGTSFAKEIIPLLQGQTPLYVRAKNIVSQLDELLLQAHIHIQQVIAYDNQPKTLDPSLKPEPNNILIFTSPSAYKSFVINFGWEDNYIAIAIGRTTFNSFDNGIRAFVSPTQTINGCIDFANDLVQKLP